MNTTMQKAGSRDELVAAVRAAIREERRAFQRWRAGQGGDGWEELQAAGEKVKEAEMRLADWNPW